MKPVKLDKTLESNIVNDYRQGISIIEIAKRYKVSRATVNNIRVRNNIPNRKTKVNNQLISKVVNLYNLGYSITELSKKLKVDKGVCSKILHKEIEELDANKVSQERQRLVKANPFVDIDNDTTAYFLGLLATDGCVSDKGKISLGLTDLELIEDINWFLGGQLNIYKYVDKRHSNAKPMHYIYFKNPDIVNTLVSLGLTPRKTKTLKVSFSITYSFLRGVIDGDGCIVKESQKSIAVFISTHSKNFCLQLSEFLLSNNYKHSVYEVNSMFTIRIGRKQQLLKLYDSMYKQATVYLERKRKLFDIIR